jgi:hypothetical protein
MPKKNTAAKISKHLVSIDGNGNGRLLTPGEAAEFLRCSVSSLNKWRVSGRGPPFIKVGVLVRYRFGDVIAYVETQTRASTSASEAPAA